MWGDTGPVAGIADGNAMNLIHAAKLWATAMLRQSGYAQLMLTIFFLKNDVY
jgi:hypothetical protein